MATGLAEHFTPRSLPLRSGTPVDPSSAPDVCTVSSTTARRRFTLSTKCGRPADLYEGCTREVS